MPKQRLTWERHGDVWRLVDQAGYVLAYLDYQFVAYYAVHFAAGDTWKQSNGSLNKKRLMAEVKRLVREALAS